MGGGVGLVAVADWVIAEKGAQIGTPEVTVGIVPAQITPFLVQRIGTAHARRLAAFGLRLDAEEAHRIGLVHELAANHGELMDKGAAAINQCLRCAPEAVAETKSWCAPRRASRSAACSTTPRTCSPQRWPATPRRASARSSRSARQLGSKRSSGCDEDCGPSVPQRSLPHHAGGVSSTRRGGGTGGGDCRTSAFGVPPTPTPPRHVEDVPRHGEGIP